MKNERYNSGLKNLHLLIQQASTKYANEFVWQDVKLTEEFKNAYTEVLKSNGYDIEFFDCSAVITTSQGRYIFVPNQWFVIASLWGDRIFEKCGIRRDEGGDGGKTLEIRGKRRLSARDGGANYQQS